jgi:hypothetical protein
MLLRPRLADKGIGFGVLERVDSQVDIEIGPIQMVGAWALHIRDLADRRVLKPGKVFKGQKELPLVEEQPDAVG